MQSSSCILTHSSSSNFSSSSRVSHSFFLNHVLFVLGLRFSSSFLRVFLPHLLHTHTHTPSVPVFSQFRAIGSRFQDLTFHFLEDLESVKKLVGAGSKFRECQCANLSLSLSLSPHQDPPTHRFRLPS
jgi:hypothetical protein